MLFSFPSRRRVVARAGASATESESESSYTSSPADGGARRSSGELISICDAKTGALVSSVRRREGESETRSTQHTGDSARRSFFSGPGLQSELGDSARETADMDPRSANA